MSRRTRRQVLLLQALFVQPSCSSSLRASSEVAVVSSAERRSWSASRAAVKEQLLHNAGTSHLVRDHVACERHFDRCWSSATNQWSEEAVCATDSAATCAQVLCGTWLEANCLHGGKKCDDVVNMCGAQAPSAQPEDVSATTLLTYIERAGVEVNGTEENGDLALRFQEGVPDKGLVFLHIPKNAGTAIENAGLTSRVRWGRHRMSYFGMMAMPDDFYCATHHIPPSLLPDVIQNIYRRSEVFCVTRHPYDRAVSEYKYLLSVPWGQNKPGVLDREPCTPEGLNFFLQTALQMVIEGKRYVNDCHMLPQSEFIWDGQQQWCTDVLRFDRMPQVFNQLMKKRNYKVRLDHTENQSRGTCPDLSEEDLTNKTMEMLDQVYANDFSLLNYSTGPGAVTKVPLSSVQLRHGVAD